MDRERPTRDNLLTGKGLTHVAFLTMFSVYVVAAVVWLVVGLAPAVVNVFPPLHDTLHRWGCGDRVVYVEISAWDGALEQRQAWAEWAKKTRELTLQAGAETVIVFQNHRSGDSHNLSIYTDSTAATPLYRGATVPGPVKDGDASPRIEYRFTAPGHGTYFFRSDVNPELHGTVRVLADDEVLPSPTLAHLADGLARAAHISDPLPAVVLQYLFSVVNLCLGVILVRVRPRDWAARLLAVGMIGTGAVFNLQSHSVEYLSPVVNDIHGTFHWVAGVAYIGALLLFPDGKLFANRLKRRWFRWPVTILYLVFFAFLGLTLGSTIHGDPESFIAFFGVLIPLTGITSQAFRSRHASTVEERRLSWVLMWGLVVPFSMALMLGLFALVSYGATSFGPPEQQIEGLRRIVFVVFPPLFAVIPVALFAIMTRYHLWDIDKVINRALVYGMLTGILGLTYLVSVVILGSVVTLVVGQSANSVVVAVSTLAVTAVFGPARRWIQVVIDRRFDRGKYDAARILAAFGTIVSDEVDLRRLNADVLTVVAQTLQPTQVALWLRAPDIHDRGLARNDSRSHQRTITG